MVGITNGDSILSFKERRKIVNIEFKSGDLVTIQFDDTNIYEVENITFDQTAIKCAELGCDYVQIIPGPVNTTVYLKGVPDGYDSHLLQHVDGLAYLLHKGRRFLKGRGSKRKVSPPFSNTDLL